MSDGDQRFRPGWLLRPGIAVCRPLFRLMWRMEAIGTENVPRRGPVILAVNHMGGFDGPLVVAFAPRPSHFLTKAELDHGLLGKLIAWIGQIPVDRRNGRGALRVTLEALQQGRVVGIFPEGVRGRGDVASVKAGVAWLAVHSGGAAVVPVACLGTRETGRGRNSIPRFRQRIVVSFGEPRSFPQKPGQARREAVSEAAESIRGMLADHVSNTVEKTGVTLPHDDVGVAQPDPDADTESE